MSFTFPAVVRPTLFGAALMPGGKVSHRFLGADTAGGRVAVVAADGTVVWETRCERPRDCWGTPDGNYFFCYAGGVMEKLDDGRTLWEYIAEPGSEVSSCQPLPNGRFLVAENGPCRLVEVDTFGNVGREILLAPPHPSLGVEVVDRLRGARKLPDGSFLVCRKGERVVEEIGPDGRSRRRIPVAGDVHMAVRLPNGHLLVALGDGKQLQELDAELKVVWAIEENDVPGNPLHRVSGFQRLPNGNTIVCNDLSPDRIGRQPQAFEVTREKRLVWEFADHANFTALNQIQVLPESAGGKTEPVWR